MPNDKGSFKRQLASAWSASDGTAFPLEKVLQQSMIQEDLNESDEEIDKQRIDEKLDALSRAKLILNQGNDVQKHNIALTLPSLVRVFQAEAVEQRNISSYGPDIRLSLILSVKLLQSKWRFVSMPITPGQRMFTVNEICQYILPALFSRLDVNIKEGGSELAGWQSSTGAPASTTKNPSSGTVIHFTLPDSDSIFTVDTSLDGTKLAGSISDEHFTSETEQWLSLLKNLLECDTRGECVRKYIHDKYEFHRPLSARLLCTRIIGIISGNYRVIIALLLEFIKDNSMFNDLVTRALKLCQDTEMKVRMSMARELVNMASSPGFALSIGNILPEVVELLHDECVDVRGAAFHTLVGFCNGEEQARSGLLAVFENVPDVPVAQALGKIVLCFTQDAPSPSPAIITMFYDKFIELCRSDDVTCRHSCAFNYPAMLTCLPSDYTDIRQSLYESLLLLCKDSSVNVRHTVSSFISTIVGRLPIDIIKTVIIGLLNDDDENLKNKMFSVIDNLLTACGKSAMSLVDAIIPSLILITCRKWRVICAQLSAISSAAKFSSSDVIFNTLVPPVFGILLDRSMPLEQRRCAGRQSLVLMRLIKYKSQRLDLGRRFLERLAHVDVYSERMMYLYICEDALDLCSRRLFKEHFFISALDMVKDHVPNVRARAVGLLPALKRILRLPGDLKLLQMLDERITSLASDSDRCVASVVECSVKELKAIQPASESATSTMEADIIDRRRVDDEALLIDEGKESISSSSTMIKKTSTTVKKPTSTNTAKLTSAQSSSLLPVSSSSTTARPSTASLSAVSSSSTTARPSTASSAVRKTVSSSSLPVRPVSRSGPQSRDSQSHGTSSSSSSSRVTASASRGGGGGPR